MARLVTAPIRAGKHLVIWVVWHSTHISLVPSGEPDKRS
jgi:hypothetical protein